MTPNTTPAEKYVVIIIVFFFYSKSDEMLTIIESIICYTKNGIIGCIRKHVVELCIAEWQLRIAL